jgi:uncharacterized DUF497 family protein
MNRPEFEFDPQKSLSNLEKHGMDFESAQMLWQDIDLIEIPAKTSDELRSLIVGKIAAKHWSAVITYRHDKVRIISVRRSRKTEVNLYESMKGSVL